jgi:hypothetical protein
MQQGNSTKGLENDFLYERKQKLYNMCQKLAQHNWEHLLYVTADIASFQRFYKNYLQWMLS